MANPRRFAYLCFLVVALANCGVLGKIRGANTQVATDKEVRTLDATLPTSDSAAAVRSLKHQHGHRNGMRKHHHGNGMHGHNMAKGGAKGGHGEVTDEYAEEHHHPIDPDSEYPHPHPESPEYEHGHGYVDDEAVEEHIEEEDEEHPVMSPKGGAKGGGTKGGGTKGGTKGGGAKGGGVKEEAAKEGGTKGGGAKGGGYKVSGEKKSGKYGKYKGGKHKSGKAKGYDKSGKHKGSGKEKGSKGEKGYYKGKTKSKKGGYDKGYKGGKSSKDKSKKGKSSYHGKAVEKKAKSTKDTHYVKSKYKLKKSSDSYEYPETPSPTEHPPEPEGPTVVEVPVTFYFAFDKPSSDEEEKAGEAEEEKAGEEPEGRRRLEDAHSSMNGSYQPSQEEMATFQKAVKEYAVGLFEYLHEAKPDTFISVEPTVDQVVVKPDDDYPLQVDVTFHVLYNEPPDRAPDAAEVAQILQDAFSADEFTFFYLWGRDDIWNNVSSVKVEPNLPEEPESPSHDGPADPEVEVYSTMVYDFSVDPTTEPSETDFDQLTSLTESFFTDLLTDLYKGNPDTQFESLEVSRMATTFDLGATPPVIVDFKYDVKFAEGCMIIPSDEELFDIMAGNMFDSYIRLYLEPCECFWSDVDRVGFLEYSAPDDSSDEQAASSPEEEGGLVPPVSTQAIQSSMIHSFFEGTESRPSKEDYTKLEMATNFFFTETLNNYYKGNNATEVLMSSTEIESSFYSEDEEQPLQVDYITSVLFQGVGPDAEAVFGVLQSADYQRYIMEYLWPEGEPWNNINGVMIVDRIESDS